MTSATARRFPVLALAGNPNSGKTTLFNRLTGLRQKVANYAGVTVEGKEGDYAHAQGTVHLIDLPGTYSLSPQSEEQRIACEVLLGLIPGQGAPDGALVIVDSTALEKSLYLVLQILDTGVPTAVILNMTDELELRGARIDQSALSRLLGVPVVPISATRGTGMADLEARLRVWPRRQNGSAGHAMLPLPVIEEAVRRREKAKHIADQVFTMPLQPHPWSDRIDDVVMHPFWGPLVFTVVVAFVFQSIFTWARPLMNLVNGVFSRLGGAVHATSLPSLASSFLADGVIAGVGSVVVFLPQILIVFTFIAILENSGYLARAALVMDKLMQKMGLQGKSFLPLISSYACAVPGIMATRTIENRRDRLATMFIAPFMTCSARLPVYALLISAFVPDKPLIGRFFGFQAFTLLSLYVVGFMAALITARLLKSSVLRSDPIPFILEVPPYRVPQWKGVLLLLWDRSRAFLQRAGTVILLVSVVMWALASFPRSPDGKTDIRDSFAGRAGRLIEPLIRPLGFDWQIGIGLISAQVAREVMVSTLSTIYQVNAKDNDSKNLQRALQRDMTPAKALSLMIFFALAMQCMSTLAIVRRETGSWKIPVIMFIYMNAVAYAASFVTYQAARVLGWG